MSYLLRFIDIFLHLDLFLGDIIQQFGAWSYAILFLIIFCETGLVFAPFLPGDSLLFVSGAFAAAGAFQIIPLFVLLLVAAILGDAVNYWVGRELGEKFLHRLKKEHVEKTQSFFERYGGKTIILARFVPIVRTIAPFVAGVGRMNYARFAMFNILGAILWVTLFVFAGYFFGNLPSVRDNFTLVILLVVFLSILPPILEWARSRRRAPSA